MSNLKNLFDSISNIEEQSKILESNVKTIGKITDIKTSLDESVTTLETINNDFEETKGSIIENINNIKTLVENIKTDSISGFSNIVNANNLLATDIKQSTETKISNSNAVIQGYIRTEIESLGTKIYNDLTKKFDDNKKEIKELITEENKQLKVKVNELDKKLKNNSILLILILSLSIFFAGINIFLITR